MLERLELNFFKKHEHLVVDFTPGLNGVVGPNYRGKTTVIYGILYCLGGARLVPGTRLQTRGTNAGFRQVLTLGINGKGRYRIERTKTGASLTELCEDGSEQPVATGTTPVNAAISRLIGMPLKRFAQIKYAKQRAASSILQAGSTELFKIITELTGLERVGLVLDRTGAQLKSWRTVMEANQLTDLAQQQEQVQAWLDEETELDVQIRALEARHSAMKAQRGAATEDERRLSAAQTAVYGAVSTLRHAERELGEAEANAESAQAQLADFRGDPKGADELADMEQELATLKAQVQSAKYAHNQVKQIERELATEQSDLQTAQAQAAPARDHYQTLRAAGIEVEVDLQTLRDKASTATALVQIQSDKLQGLIEAGKSGVCHSCQRSFEAFDPVQHAAHVSEVQQVRRDLMAEAERSKSDLAAEEAYRQDLSQAEAAWNKADGQVHALQQSCNRLSAQLGQAADTALTYPPAEMLDGQIKTLDVALQIGRRDGQRLATAQQASANAQGQLAQRTRAHAEARDELQRLRTEHQVEAVDLSAALQAAREHADQLDRELRKLSDFLNSQRNRAQSAHSARTALERGMAAATERNQQHMHAAKQVVLLSELLDYIRSNRDRYSKSVWDVFMASASMFASDATGGVIEAISRDEDGAFAFIEEGYEMEQAEASGAQLAILGTAVQLALADAALSPLNLVLMDEPTADMDPERALAFSTLLASSGKQVIMITHREMDATVFDNTVEL
jgi:DNA repair exonuclease SbcCD ATPase subunit